MENEFISINKKGKQVLLLQSTKLDRQSLIALPDLKSPSCNNKKLWKHFTDPIAYESNLENSSGIISKGNPALNSKKLSKPIVINEESK